MKDAVFSAIDRKTEKYIAVWKRFAELESPTRDKAGVDLASEYIAAIGKELGFSVSRFPMEGAGDIFEITLNPSSPLPPVCFSGHVDTVHARGSFGIPTVRIEDGKIYGPGVTDCKGGIVAALLAMDALREAGFTSRPVRLLLQSDEEMGSRPSLRRTINTIIDRARGAVAFLNLEETHPDTVTIARKGILTFTFHIRGQAAHASMCATMGANAIKEAAHKILACEQWKNHDGVTASVGVIEGGTVPNAVAEECTFRVDVRYVTPEEREEVTAFMRELAEKVFVPGCVTELTFPARGRIAMVRTEQNEALCDRLNDIFEENGLPRLRPILSRGGSDAADVTEAGIPCLDNFGTVGGWVHSTREYGRLDSLAPAARRLALAALYL